MESKALSILDKHVKRAGYDGANAAFITRPRLLNAVKEAMDEALHTYFMGGETHQHCLNILKTPEDKSQPFDLRQMINPLTKEEKGLISKVLSNEPKTICYHLFDEWAKKLMPRWDIDSFCNSHKTLFASIMKAVESGIKVGMEQKTLPHTLNDNNNLLNNTMESNKENKQQFNPEETEQIHVILRDVFDALRHLSISQQNKAIEMLIKEQHNKLSLNVVKATDEYDQKQKEASHFEGMLEEFVKPNKEKG